MNSSDDSMLTVRGLSAGYGARAVIDGLTLPPLRRGRLVALVGPNAAGKSTLLRAMANLIRARGEISLGKRDLLNMRPAERAATVGFMPQSLPNDVSLTVLETVIAALKVTGATEAEAPVEEQAFGVLARLGVGYLASKPLDKLSGGQKQVASLAQAIACKPSLLLLDEPISALDLARQFFVMRVIKDYAAAGAVVVAVLHDLALAAQWADEMVVMADARLHSAGPPDAIVTPKMLAEVYSIEARVERCSQNRIQIMVDGVVPHAESKAVSGKPPHEQGN